MKSVSKARGPNGLNSPGQAAKVGNLEMQHKQPIVKIAKMAWLLVCFLIGINYFNKGPLAGDYMPDFLTMMTIVTFPIGYLALYLVKAMVWFLPSTLGNETVRSYNIAIALWVMMTILGYFQWFYLIPQIYAKIARSKSNQ